jgi:hypothetical protein
MKIFLVRKNVGNNNYEEMCTMKNKQSVLSISLIIISIIVLFYSIIEIYQKITISNFPRVSTIILFLYATITLSILLFKKKKN